MSFERARPAYAVIKDTLARRIGDGTLAEGTVLLEGPLAELFRSSRSPVKQAFAGLEAEGLVRRFGGRGVAVGAADAVPRGLGLAIAKQVADLNGWHLSVRSAPGEGTCFALRLGAPETATPPARRRRPRLA